MGDGLVLGDGRRVSSQPRRLRLRRLPASHRAFDPRLIGALESAAWVAYYRRRWLTFLYSAMRLTRSAFHLPWPATVYGAWLVLRANQLWAPLSHNDPDGARRTMERFYRLVQEHYQEAFDPAVAAALEVEWWRVHRKRQYSEAEDETELILALASLYAYVFGVPAERVTLAGEQRALAMRYSDEWVREGCDPGSPLVAQERAALVRSFAALLAAVHVQ